MTTQELTKEVVDLKTHSAALSQKVDEACLRLGAVEREVKEQGKLLQSIDRLAMGLSRLDEKLTDVSAKMDVLGGRINLIELKPAEKWERIVYEVLKYLVLAGVGFLIAKLF